MPDYNPNTVSAYQQYASSMSAGGGGSNMSGLGAKTSSSGRVSSRLDDKGYTPTKSTSTKSGIAYIENYGDDSDNIPMTPEQIYTAAAQATTEVGGLLVPNVTAPMIHAANLYSMPNMVEQVSDYVYRADRNDAITSAIRSTQQEEQDSVDAAIKSINKAITQGKTDAEIAEAFLNDMGGMGNDKPDPNDNFGVPGVTLKDVTGTDEGALSNPQPLYDFAEEMRNPSITVEELPPLTPDQKDKLGAKLREAGAKGDLSSVMNKLAQDSKIQLSSAVSNFIEGAETQVASNDIDPFTGKPFGGGDELGFVDVSPSAEAEEQRGLMARPAAASERLDPSYWDKVMYGDTEAVSEEPKTYNVKSGDTLYSIAKKSGVTLAKLVEANPDIDPDKISIDQSINIPVGAELSELPADIQQTVAEAEPKTDKQLNVAIFDGANFSGEIATPKPGDDPLTWIAQNTFGLNENDPNFRKAFKTIAGIDPKKVPWCGAFANHVLKNMGVDLPERAQQNPLLAFNYVNLGKEVYNHNPTTDKTYAGKLSDVKSGDVVVFNNSKRDNKGNISYGTGHVAFVVGTEDDGSIIAVGGNQGGGKKVATTKYTPAIIKKYFKGGYTVRRIDSGALEQTDPAIIAAITKDISMGSSER